MRQGDILAILVGGRVPYVLRRSKNNTTENPNIYYFIGECYIDGIMRGELHINLVTSRLTEIGLEYDLLARLTPAAGSIIANEQEDSQDTIVEDARRMTSDQPSRD